MSVSTDAIYLRSNYDVWLIGRISRPAFLDTGELVEQGFGTKTNYQITLSFTRKIGANTYRQLKANRAPYLDLLEHGGVDKGEWGHAMRGYATNRVPVYFTGKHSIFVDQPDDRWVETVPPKAVIQAQTLLSNLAKVLEPYER